MLNPKRFRKQKESVPKLIAIQSRAKCEEHMSVVKGGVNFTTTADKPYFVGFCTATMRNKYNVIGKYIVVSLGTFSGRISY